MMNGRKIFNVAGLILLFATGLFASAYGQSGDTSQGTPVFPPLTITTDQLTVTGKGTPAQPVTPPPESFVPLTIATEQITVTGKGTPEQPVTPPPESFKPVTISTDTLSVTGKGAAVTPRTQPDRVPPAPRPQGTPSRNR